MGRGPRDAPYPISHAQRARARAPAPLEVGRRMFDVGCSAFSRHFPAMRRVLLTLFVLFLAATLGGLWYASKKGFTSKWRGYVKEEFHKRGVEVTLRRLTLDPLRGLVAKEVRVFDARGKNRVLA